MHRKRILRLKKIPKGKFRLKKPLPKNTSYLHLIKENVDYDDKDSILSVKNTVDIVCGTAEAARRAKKAVSSVYSGTVKGINGTRKLVSRVNRLRNAPITSKNVRRFAGRVIKSGISLAGKSAGERALDIRDRVLSASIDKSKITDTGMETINQGITYVRYADNARRAIVNTEKAAVSGIKTSVNAVKKIKSLPNDTVNAVRRTEQTVRNAAVRTKQTAKAIANAGKKVVSVIGKVVTSKSLPVILAAAALLIIVLLLSNFISSIMMMIGGIFSWADGDENDYKKQIGKYMTTVQEIVEEKQEEIDDVYYGFECDRTEYEPYNEIIEFREERFTYRKIAIDSDDEYKKVIAIAAARWYTETLKSENPPDDLKLKKEQLEEVIEKSYQLDYEYEQDYCPHHDCCKWGNIMTGGNAEEGIYAGDAWYCDTYYHGCKEIREWYDKDIFTGEWNWDEKKEGIRSFCDRKHDYLKGEVQNFSLDVVMGKMDMTDEEKDVYETYYTAINEWLAEE